MLCNIIQGDCILSVYVQESCILISMLLINELTRKEDTVCLYNQTVCVCVGGGGCVSLFIQHNIDVVQDDVITVLW